MWPFDRTISDLPHNWVRKAGEIDTDKHGEPCLPLLLKAARKNWTDEDVWKVLTKLKAIKIKTTSALLEALDVELRGLPQGVNARLHEKSLKLFNDSTIKA